MRKIKYLEESIYFILMVAPLVFFAVALRAGYQDTFVTFMEDKVGFILMQKGGVLEQTLSGILGQEIGLMPIATQNIIMYIQYIAGIFFLHLLIDCVLFLPRLCMRFIDKAIK